MTDPLKMWRVVSWLSSLVHRTQALVLSAAEGGFESHSRHLCPWARHWTITALSTLSDSAFCSTSQAPSGWYQYLHPYGLWRDNPVAAPGVGGTVPLVTVDLGRSPKSVNCSRVAILSLVMLGRFLTKKSAVVDSVTLFFIGKNSSKPNPNWTKSNCLL